MQLATVEQQAPKVIDLQSHRQIRWVIEMAVRSWLKRGMEASRYAFEVAAGSVMRSHGISRLDFTDFSLVLLPWGGMKIRARRHIRAQRCPNCGAKPWQWRYLHTKFQGTRYDIVTWGCTECGRVFARAEQNGEEGEYA